MGPLGSRLSKGYLHPTTFPTDGPLPKPTPSCETIPVSSRKTRLPGVHSLLKNALRRKDAGLYGTPPPPSPLFPTLFVLNVFMSVCQSARLPHLNQ